VLSIVDACDGGIVEQHRCGQASRGEVLRIAPPRFFKRVPNEPRA
jgi:hypothetical protein